jgi:hypothetical protein
VTVSSAVTQNALPSGSASTTQENSPKLCLPVSGSTQIDQPRHFSLHVRRGEVDVHPILARRRIRHPLKAELRSALRRHDNEFIRHHRD